MTDKAIELKPCPFCGGCATLHKPTCRPDSEYNPNDRAFPWIICSGCGATVNGDNWDARGYSAVELWSTRAALEQKAEPVADVTCCGQFEVEYSSDGLASHEICCGRPDIDQPTTAEVKAQALEEMACELKQCGPAQSAEHYAGLLTAKAKRLREEG